MFPEIWKNLREIDRETYKLFLDKQTTESLAGTNFLHICFNSNDRKLITIDSNGVGYLLESNSIGWKVKCLGIIGQSTFVSFNPIVETEILIGQTTADLKILKFSDFSLNEICLLKGHQVPPSWVSFYQNYCLTSSKREAVIWDLRTGGKIHQFCSESKESNFKKSIFSNNGMIAALYENDTIRIWQLDKLETNTRLQLTEHGIRDVEDLIFSENGRCLIVCGGKRKILIFDTRSCTLSMNFELPGKFSVAKRLEVLPQTLDSGFRKVLVILFDDGKLKFMDLSTKSFIEASDRISKGIRKFSVSSQGQWIAFIESDGSLTISSINQLINRPADPPSSKTSRNDERKKSPPKLHRADQHLQSVREKPRKELDREKLLSIFEEFNEYPKQYRHVIWKSLLGLPENREACLTLSGEVSDGGFELEILKNWKLADSIKGSLLSMTVERLVSLCPLLEQSFFIPELVFPFLIVFEKDPLAGFEACLMILMNFCQKWFEYHPLPPINVLGIIENILMEADQELLIYFNRIGVTSTEYAWPLLRTTLSEVLTANEWLILWDHIFSLGKPSFLTFCTVAYAICSREIIFKVLKNNDDVREFFGNQGQVGVREIIQMAKKLEQGISKSNHPSRYLLDELKFLPKSGSYPQFLLNEYPEFLVKNGTKNSKLQLLRKEEATLRKQRREAAKIAKEKKIREETQNFLKEVHNQRLEELQKCYEQQIKLTEMSVAREREKLDQLSASGELPDSTESVGENNIKAMEVRSRGNSCEELRKNIEVLEDEVQSFLESMRTSRSLRK